MIFDLSYNFSQKRQFNPDFQNPNFHHGGHGSKRPQFGGSQSSANANSNSHNFRPDGFDSANAIAGAQGKRICS